MLRFFADNHKIYNELNRNALKLNNSRIYTIFSICAYTITVPYTQNLANSYAIMHIYTIKHAYSLNESNLCMHFNLLSRTIYMSAITRFCGGVSIYKYIYISARTHNSVRKASASTAHREDSQWSRVLQKVTFFIRVALTNSAL